MAAMLLFLALAPSALGAGQASAPYAESGHAQIYSDPKDRFGFTAPTGWARLADSDPDEVTFQSDTGDNIRATIAPLKVPMNAFLDAYVDTYLDVLSQSFSDVKFLGEKTTVVAGREASDYEFVAVHNGKPVTCRQVVLFGGDQLIYLTFAGFGPSREFSEQLFNIALMTLWVHGDFGGTTVGRDPSVASGWPFLIDIPAGWVEYSSEAQSTRIFRPTGARAMSPMITIFNETPSAGLPTAVDDDFLKVYAARVCGYYKPAPCQISTALKTTVGGEPAIRLDYRYAADLNMRRVALVLAMRNGKLIGIACESADAAFPGFQRSFEATFSSVRFQ